MTDVFLQGVFVGLIATSAAFVLGFFGGIDYEMRSRKITNKGEVSSNENSSIPTFIIKRDEKLRRGQMAGR